MDISKLFQSSSSSRTDPGLEEVNILHAKFAIIHTLEITNSVMSIFEMSNLELYMKC